MSERTQRWCIWCGPIFTLMFAAGFWGVAGLMPLPSPGLTAQQGADLFAANQSKIRLGLAIAVLAGSFYLPFSAVISSHLRRIEGDYSPMAYLQLAGGVGSYCAFYYPLMSLQAADYRAERAPAIVQALTDTGWMQFMGAYAPPMLQFIAVAVVILQDEASPARYPRWVAYFNIWMAVLLAPGALLVFVKGGPLAWNGLFVWWIPAAAFFGWIVVMTAVLLGRFNSGPVAPHNGPESSGSVLADAAAAPEPAS